MIRALSVFLLLGTLFAVGIFWLIATLLLGSLRRLRYITALSLPKANTRIALLVVVFGIGFI